MGTLFVENSVEINATSHKVWKALTDPDLSRQWIRLWWPEFDILESQWQIGSPVYWRLCNGDIGAEGIVVLMEPFSKLAFSFKVLEAGFEKQEMITYQLRDSKDITLLSVSVGDFGDSPEHEACYPGAVASWNKSLPKIKRLAESMVKVNSE